MVKTLLTGLAVGGIVLGYYLYNAATKFSFSIAGYGVPQPSANWSLNVPVSIRFNNPAAFGVTLDLITIDAYLLKNGAYEHVGHVAQPLTLPAGSSTQQVLTQLDLGNIFGGFLQTLRDAISSEKVTIRTDVTVRYKGVDLPMQSFTNDLKV